jgi:flagellar hook assembly protein FlgD
MKTLIYISLAGLVILGCSKEKDDDDDNIIVDPNLIWQTETVLDSTRQVTWDGFATSGAIVPDGNYRMIVEAETESGQTIIDTIQLVIDSQQ